MTIAALLCAPVLAHGQTPTTAAPSTSLPGKIDMLPSLLS